MQRFEDQRKTLTYGNNYTTICFLTTSIYLYHQTKEEINVLEATLRKPIEIKCSNISSKIVYILGESFNKHHSNLYGYSMLTNPQLELESKRGNLSVYKDVITPFRATIDNLKYILSFANQENGRYWCETPLFPTLFKQAGYNTLFVSNQETKKDVKDYWEIGNNYLVSDKTAPLLFDKQNTEKFQYDEALLQEYVRLSKNQSGDKELVIFHLMGQHSGYVDRFPESESRFSVSNYGWRKDLSEKQKTVIAEYDNATLYNDKVVAGILDFFRDDDVVVIYMSDHGEEVYDYRDFVGRSLEDTIDAKVAKYVYQIPFMIWISDKYMENHPDIAEKVKRSVDRPFMTDDLPHLMLDLAGIECEWFEPSRSLINDEFNANRKRLLEDSKQDYDLIMKSADLY